MINKHGSKILPEGLPDVLAHLLDLEDPLLECVAVEAVDTEDHVEVDAEVDEDRGDVAQLQLPALVPVVAKQVEQGLERRERYVQSLLLRQPNLSHIFCPRQLIV